AYLAYMALARRLPGATRLDWCALAFIVAYAIAIATSLVPRLSLEGSLLIGAGVVVFYAFHDTKLLAVDQMLRALVLVGVAVSLLALLSVVSQYLQWLAA